MFDPYDDYEMDDEDDEWPYSDQYGSDDYNSDMNSSSNRSEDEESE